ncbi:MAG: malectin domain-containing carbohydrate-binding protein [Verrucomicrobiota bacterium]
MFTRFKKTALPIIYCLVLCSHLMANKRVAYIYGDVAADGTIPSGAAAPYDQMLLTDPGNTGLSVFKGIVEGEGYTIEQHYDRTLNFNAAFLAQYDVVIFGLHQRIWAPTEQAVLDDWIQAGGGILLYSDSAAGGLFSLVGIKNSVGQSAVNSILSNYGMQVTVDQGGGTRGYFADADASNPVVYPQLIFEGEGVSPIAVDPLGVAEVVIPFRSENRASGGNLNIDSVNVTISNPDWAAIALAEVGEGHVMAIFDRQPLWNNGPGSDIDMEDNREILRRLVRFLARDYGNSKEWFDLRIESGDPQDFQISFRQWLDGSGSDGFNYTARNSLFALEHSTTLASGEWRIESALVEEVGSAAQPDGESERVTVRVVPDPGSEAWFVRLVSKPATATSEEPTADAGRDQWIALSGSAFLEATAANATTTSWSKESGPGTVTFSDDESLQTTATFSAAGTYELSIEASDASGTSALDTAKVVVFEDSDIVIAINSGGGDYSALSGIEYVSDIYFVGGGADQFPGNSVAGTEDDLLYNFARSKNSTFTGYSIPVDDGNYLVLLQFAETFFSTDNSRVFDLSIEGQLRLDDFDIHEVAPGKWVAVDLVFSSTVADDSLDIVVTASSNNPLINAIVVFEVP